MPLAMPSMATTVSADLNLRAILKGLRALSFLHLLACASLAIAATSESDPSRKPYDIGYGKIILRGALTPQIVNQLIGDPEAASAEMLIIDSTGGDVLAGIQLGEWVLKQKLKVIVDRKCLSSCANYVFAAGRERVINPGGIVLWHGGAEQKNFRELQEKFELLAERAKANLATADDQLFLKDKAKLYDTIVKGRAGQKRLYAALGVNEKIMLIGQEPTAYDATMWGVTPAGMARLRLTGISLPKGYGDSAYVERWKALNGVKSKIVILDVDENGVVSEAR
jgi:hypothetical protein